MFEGRTLLIATKHKKEQVIAPILEQSLRVRCITDSSLDTDQLGTFTGEVERPDDPLTTARKKCQLAMEQTQCDLVLASEGSFGPHPSLVFVPADEEWLVLTDFKHNLELKVRSISAATNFSGKFVATEEELNAFLATIKFPSHAVILRKSREEATNIYKGLTDQKTVTEIFYGLLKTYNQVFIETDMRALFNPTRMKVIEELSLKLSELAQSLCPSCSRPGFGITEVVPGLPCELCYTPTKAALKHIHQCEGCSFRQEQVYPKEKQFEDPMYCDVCNP